MNYKRIAQIIEHIVLVSLIAGSLGFYLGNQYGKTQVDVNALKTAPAAPTVSK
jgi:hypothetical protein